MTTETRVVALSLNEIIKFNVRALIRRFHLNHDWIIGLIGERGSGKSLGGGNIAFRDFMLNDEHCWSNMRMKMNVEVEDAVARYYGLEGGTVNYEAGFIDKQSFLALDSRYEGGCLFFDEFNLEYGEARRSSSNVNLMTDRAIQQLRKIQSGLIYTVLNEMYVDNRIRENTDVFIKCTDVALNPGNILNKMEQGTVFEWNIYPMTARVAGNGQTYNETHKTIGPVQMTLKNLWDSIDTYERQAEGLTRYTQMPKEVLFDVGTEDTPEIKQEKDKWAYLDAKITQFYNNHKADGDVIEITSKELQREFGVDSDHWGPVVRNIRKRIPDIEVRGRGSYKDPTKYLIPNDRL